MTVNDLVQPVIGKMRGRSDAILNVPYWIAMALIDLSMNYEFEELKCQGPVTNFVQNIASYPLSGYDPLGINGNPFIQATEHRITFIRSFFCWYVPSGTITVGQSTGFEINYRDWRVVEPMSKILGIPSVVCIFGDKATNGQLVVGMMPDNPYPCQLSYQREHPFNCGYEQVLQSYGNSALINQIAASRIYLPHDWTEIITLAAAEKGCDDLGLNDVGQLYHNKLYGYKDKRGNEMPGLITVRLTQQDRQVSFNSRQLRPIVKRYT